jgi:uncharacterized protein (TIGR02611 family)
MSDVGTPMRPRALQALRSRVVRLPGGELIWRISIGVIGLLIVVVGAILLPLPGPGWLIIFLGLGLWATEFRWAARLLARARRFVSSWTRWIMARPLWLRLTIGLFGLALTASISIGLWYLL